MLSAWLTAFPAASKAEQPSLEYPVKATFLYKFAPFIGWPPAAFSSPTSPFNICVVGTDPFGPVLDRAVAGQQVGGHPVAVRRMAEVAGGAPGCHILYTVGSKTQAAAAVLAAVRGAPVLTVTDGAYGDGVHGVIHFVLDGARVRFDIDLKAAAANGLEVSSKLLSLAVSVLPAESAP